MAWVTGWLAGWLVEWLVAAWLSGFWELLKKMIVMLLISFEISQIFWKMKWEMILMNFRDSQFHFVSRPQTPFAPGSLPSANYKAKTNKFLATSADQPHVTCLSWALANESAKTSGLQSCEGSGGQVLTIPSGSTRVPKPTYVIFSYATSVLH